jgi:hypothetical protein
MTRSDIAPYNIAINVEAATTTTLSIWIPSIVDNATHFVQIFGEGDPEALIVQQVLDKAYGLILNTTELTVHPTTGYTMSGVQMECIVDDSGMWKESKVIIGQWNNTAIDPDTLAPYGLETFYTSITGSLNQFTYTKSIGVPVTTNGAPLDLITGYLKNNTTISVDGIIDLPGEIDKLPEWSNNRDLTITNGNYFYMRRGNSMFTNAMAIDNIVTITYTILADTPYTEVPDLSHVNNELYLTFGNTLKITANFKTGTDIEFNLPKLNDQAFTSDVNGIINISTTEVAIFLVDEIYIVTKVADEVFGYRYDYLNTRLSVGIRNGDKVINTRDGVYTLYPTNQGLAIMNYQPDVATTDQIVDYTTDNIIDLWREFYNAGRIQSLQMGNHVYVFNGTKQYLVLDLRGLTWWEFESPVPVNKMATDTNQIELFIISNGLYQFDRVYTGYKDLTNKFIDWNIESQPLHFSAPSHYKNIKQLIFQFKQSINISQTITTQIKLYRKQITIREPEIVNFKIDGYGVVVKRFNYWKINELQWAIAADRDTTAPARLQMNGISIKYEQGEEVR